MSLEKEIEESWEEIAEIYNTLINGISSSVIVFLLVIRLGI
jgi:hypothetical protein